MNARKPKSSSGEDNRPSTIDSINLAQLSLIDDEDGDGDFEENRSGQDIRLKEPLQISSLCSSSGTLLSPMEDELKDLNDPQSEQACDYLQQVDDLECLDRIGRIQNEINDQGNNFDCIKPLMVALTEDRGILKRVIWPSKSENGTVTPTATVSVHYSLYLEDQIEPFDSTVVKGKPETFRMSTSRLIPGLQIAIESMQKGEKSEFLLRPKYAFGEIGCPPRIPAQAEVLARIEVLHFVEDTEAEALFSLPKEERYLGRSRMDIIKLVENQHTLGNDHIKAGEWKAASKRYKLAICLLEDMPLESDEEEAEMKKLLLKLYVNRSLALLKVPWPKRACRDANKALAINPRSAKALYRLGKGKRLLGDYESAVKHFRDALEIVGSNLDIERELNLALEAWKRESEAEKRFCRNIFDQPKQKKLAEARMKVTEDLDDEFLEQIGDQLQGFIRSTKHEMQLPTLNDAELRVTKTMAADMQLLFDECNNVDGYDKKYVIKKPKKEERDTDNA